MMYYEVQILNAIDGYCLGNHIKVWARRIVNFENSHGILKMLRHSFLLSLLTYKRQKHYDVNVYRIPNHRNALFDRMRIG